MQNWRQSDKFTEVSICDHDVHYDLRGNLWTIWKESLEPKKINFNHAFKNILFYKFTNSDVVTVIDYFFIKVINFS